ncbi:MAG TPA: DUF1599 domain-containing protein [Edaphocola sp.]|nr:DUF1599 domain-containing protein [Edaphocola sp.]
MDTLREYRAVRERCRDVFVAKVKDYGTSWRILRLVSVIDQLYIKAWRIRSIQEAGGEQKIEDPVEGEFMAIVNYGYIALIQLQLSDDHCQELPLSEAEDHYDQVAQIIEDLMLRKNHDYGEAWRNMTQESFVDLILTKLLRIRQIMQNDGKTLVSEGVEANIYDIVNYALFALIRRQFSK